MASKVLFITPPFTQLNTPYPATAYLKGFLNTLNVPSNQTDLGIEVILRLFSRKGLTEIFAIGEKSSQELSDNSARILRMKSNYLNTIDSVISFLQDKDPTLAYSIAQGDFLPEASRFEQLAELEWAFGTLGIRDKARYFSTLYLEDLSDFITEAVDPNFGFSRYAERLGMSAATFDEMQYALEQPDSMIDQVLYEVLEEKIIAYQPTCVGLSVPFPGNLYGALKCGAYLKKNYPEIVIWMGGAIQILSLGHLQRHEYLIMWILFYLTMEKLPLQLY